MAFQGDSIFWVEVEKIVPNPFQPRREFDDEKLQELSESIRMYGVLQPLTVTRKEMSREDGTFYTEYELIAGERRLRASRLAGLAQVPVIIREGEDSEQEKLELAIIENLQREDLNAVDRALAFKQLADQFNLSHVEVGKKVGRSREYVSNSIRLLQLPDYMLDSLRRKDISEGHARSLLMLIDRPEELDTVYREVLLKKLSVREVERITRKIATDKVRKKDWQDTNPELIEMEKRFTETLGTRVQIQKTDYGGKLTIDYFSDEDLEAMLERLRADRAEQSAAGVASAAAHISEHTPLEVDGVVPEGGSTLGETEPPSPRLMEQEPAAEQSQETPTEVAQEIQQPHDEISSNSFTQTDEPQSEHSVRAYEQVEAASQPEEQKEEKPDDSNLYSMKNFGI
ncbi:MAG: ParB/RepB/Spo0J family partition protein [Patescibacteria group bacterium]